MALHGNRAVTAGDVYAANRAGHLQLGNCGAIVTGSKELIRAQLSGTEPDPVKSALRATCLEVARRSPPLSTHCRNPNPPAGFSHAGRAGRCLTKKHVSDDAINCAVKG